jgi:amino acid permease
LYTAIFMVIRFFDKSYALGGRYFSEIALKPSFNARGGYSLNHLTFVLLSMLSTSYIAHYNAPKFYTELKDTSMPRFNQVVSGAFGTSILFFILIMCTGFLTFGGATQGFVLNNYSSTDALAVLARLAIGIALLTGYPFTFSALREGLLDMAQVKGERRDALLRPATVGLLGLVTALALVLKDVGFVVSISGALFGCALMFVVPAIMTIKNLERLQTLGRPNKNHGLEKTFNYLLVATGVIMGVLGVGVSTLRQMGKL